MCEFMIRYRTISRNNAVLKLVLIYSVLPHSPVDPSLAGR